MTDDPLRKLAQQLPWDRPDAARREAVRASLLLAAEDMPPRRSRRGLALTTAFTAGALAAAAIALVVVRRERPAPPTPQRAAAPRAQLTASPAAELAHSVTATPTGSEEVVRVHAGTVRVVAPATAVTDPIRVQTRDAAVEGAGEYEVVVARDLLASVTVRSGSARVVVTGRTQPVFLAAGQTWRAEVITAELIGPDAGLTSVDGAPPEPAATQPANPAPTPDAPREPEAARPASRPASAGSIPEVRVAHGERRDPPEKAARAGVPSSPRVEPPATEPPATPSSRVDLEPGAPELPAAVRAAPGSPSPDVPRAIATIDRATSAARPRVLSETERHFQAGWALLKAGKPRDAAIELGVAADSGDREPLAVDARYFQAVALARSGAAASAERALVAFLDRAPSSLRRGRASVMLARLIAARGDAASARAWFESALRDPDPEVAAAARTGLDALSR
ncbi:MAG TPA: hypothetical protein VFK02_00865 [Kofleriaceae bacterium]|nr:hypothetical protein [Kofleriaceae bacterium]